MKSLILNYLISEMYLEAKSNIEGWDNQLILWIWYRKVQIFTLWKKKKAEPS